MSDESNEPAFIPEPEPAADTRVAKIRTLVPKVKAKGFTLGKGVTVEGVPIAHAEYLRDQGQAEILLIS